MHRGREGIGRRKTKVRHGTRKKGSTGRRKGQTEEAWKEGGTGNKQRKRRHREKEDECREGMGEGKRSIAEKERENGRLKGR